MKGGLSAIIPPSGGQVRVEFFTLDWALGISRNERLHKHLAPVHRAMLALFIANNVILRS